MAWKISMTQEGWGNVYDNLCTWSRKRLMNAIRDDFLEKHEDRKRCDYNLRDLATDTLVDTAYALIEENDTCDNGGWNVWIDTEGWHKVSTSKKGEEDWQKYPF